VATNPILDMQAALREFIHDSDATALILSGQPRERAVAAKLLEAEDRQSEDDIYLLLLHPCAQASEYVDAVATQIDEQVAAANRTRAAAARSRWPSLPLAAHDARRPAAQRLQAIVDHCDRIVPADALIVWGLLPLALDDAAGYADLVAPLVDHVGPRARHRLIFGAEPDRGLLTERDDEMALVVDLDLSRERYFDALARTAKDPRVPKQERIDALFELTQADVTHRRYAQALEKYAALFEAYAGVDPVRQAFCMCGAASVALTVGDAELAVTHAQRGLAIAVHEGSFSVLLGLLNVAGQACVRLQRHADAVGYFEHASAVAGKLFNPFAKADAMEDKGIAQLACRDPAAAHKTWETCAAFCQEFEYEARWRSVMTRLAELLGDASKFVQRREIERRIGVGMRGGASP
jgi:tetratricopeptide (TPR) repeat protein